MPTVSIYIRNSDLSKYLEIENKSEFIHNALNPTTQFMTDGMKETLITDLKPIKTSHKFPKDVPDHLKGSSSKLPQAIKGLGFARVTSNPNTVNEVTMDSVGIDGKTVEYPVVTQVIKSPKDAENVEYDKMQLGMGASGKLAAKLATAKLDKILKLCKIHGTPLDDRGKCLIKGCKYG